MVINAVLTGAGTLSGKYYLGVSPAGKRFAPCQPIAVGMPTKIVGILYTQRLSGKFSPLMSISRVPE